MKFLTNLRLPIKAADSAIAAGEFQYNSTKNKFGGSNGSSILDFVSEQILASSITGEGASMIHVEDAAGNFVAVDLEALTIEVDGRLKSLENFKEVLNNADFNVNYIKSVTGAPTADIALVDGEICLNTADNVYFTALAGAWDAGQSFLTKRAIFKNDGAATIAGLTSLHDNKIYDGASIAIPYIPNFANMIAVKSENPPNGKLYFFNGTTWVFAANLQSHNDLTGLQGGIAGQYFHLTSGEHSLVVALPSTVATEGAALIGVEAGTLDGVVGDVQAALNLIYNTSAHTKIFPGQGVLEDSVTSFVHNLNSRNLMVSVQLDNGGLPGELVEAEVLIVDANTITVQSGEAATIHVTVFSA